MSSLSSSLTDLINNKPVGDVDIAAAELFALDAIANAMAGRNSEPGGKLAAWQRDLLGERANSGMAGLDAGRRAFMHGATCHILEVDDLHRASVVHPGCVVVPVLLALGQGQPRRKVLTALLHGFEACCRIGMAVGPGHYRIWHNTATCGPFGAAMAAAHLLNLDHDETVHALGNAGSQSSGLWEFLDTGAETKHLHAGRAAESGVIAAGLAARGFTGPPEILEGERGFFKATCPDPRPELVLADPDAPWQVHLTSIKPWPSCRHTHPTIDAAQSIRRKLIADGLDVAAIETIDIDTYQAALDLCDRVDTPSAYAAKFSLQHTVCAALAHDEVTFYSFSEMARDDLASARKKVHVQTDSEVQNSYPGNWGGRVTVTLANGHKVNCRVDNAKGDPELPLDRDQMIEKANRLLTFGNVTDPEKIISAVQCDDTFDQLFIAVN
jgi:2-methylcitrate dehydratase PrpD